MKMSKILMAGTVMALSASSVYAATQGLLEATSSATSDVTMDILEQVQINAVTDLALDNGDSTNTYVPNAGDVSATNTLCVHYNNGADVFLQIDSLNGAGSGYVLTDGTDNITYLVSVDFDASGTFAPHAEGANTSYVGMADTAANCGGGNDTAIKAFILDSGATLGVGNGTYTDTLTYTVTPNP
tara:strand:- start:21511 stop:22065 length:555 start_codon:yes stop_codon:yes gene_type:complete